tara:strand:+ start:783 stop:1469 length:687 start_codon:yes stop_codon:yes gene_type:complete
MIRFFDIFFSSLALLALSPLFIFVIIFLKFTGEGEVFFLQDRVGKAGKYFKLYKFATMLKDSQNIGTGTVTIKDDPRILPLGGFLRKSKINELPQLINIFIGNMSLIGPRPQAERCFNVFPREFQDIIIKMKPGLSGIGPIVFRAEEDILDGQDNISFYDEIISPYKAEIEAWYINKQDLKTYFLLIFITIQAVLISNSSLVWKVFRDLPIPPDDLKKHLNFNTDIQK